MLARRAFLIIASLTLVYLARPSAIQAADDVKFPDIIAVKITPKADNRFDFDVTMSSPYDSPSRYADAFRVLDPNGGVLGERILLHDHADEQPFTRELTNIRIAPEISRIIVEGRDQKSGYGGKKIEMTLPGR